MPDTNKTPFESIQAYSDRLHFLWAKAGRRTATDEDREEMRLIQWGILPRLWHVHRYDYAHNRELEQRAAMQAERQAKRAAREQTMLDDLTRPDTQSPYALLKVGGFHVETIGPVTFHSNTEKHFNELREQYATNPHVLALSELRSARKQEPVFTQAGERRVELPKVADTRKRPPQRPLLPRPASPASFLPYG